MTAIKPNTIDTERTNRRIFFALWPDVSVAEALHQTADTCARLEGGRPMDKDSLHITLAFLGHITDSRIEEARMVAGRIRQRAFDLEVDKVDYWPHNHILWAGCSRPPPALLNLAEVLQTQLRTAGFKVEPRQFTPHVTLLRNCPQGTSAPLPQALLWKAREFVMVESRPEAGAARYTQIGRWSLAT
ncbi:MAG TPA: RNA 2',3'-cyclic phosphodiesterase [Rhodocyclaceae bacterium]|jgi:2'-5' RNA ligase